MSHQPSAMTAMHVVILSRPGWHADELCRALAERGQDAMTAIRAMLARVPPDGLENAVVIKPIFGSMGHGIVRVSDPDVAFRVVQALDTLRAVFYVQRAIDSGGRDIRAFVVGGRVLAAIERRAADGDWRTNVSRGGSARACAPPPAWDDVARRAAAAIRPRHP